MGHFDTTDVSKVSKGDIIRNTLCITEDTHDDGSNFVNVSDIYVCSLLRSTDLKDLFVVEAIE